LGNGGGMNRSRREFLKMASLLAAGGPVAQLLGDQVKRVAPASALGGGHHALASADARNALRTTRSTPGLLFDESDLPRIRANVAHPRFAAFWKNFASSEHADDFDFLEHRVRLNHHNDDMNRVRLLFEHAAFIYAVNGDAKELALAKLAMRRLLDFPRWDMFLEGGKTPMGLLRAAETSIALSFGLDWLGASLSEAERAEVERNIAEKGAPACYTALYGMRYPDRVKGWTYDPADEGAVKAKSLKRWPLILNSTNLKTVPAAGLGIAACRLHGRHPLAATWLEMARSSMAAFATMYGSDGCYDEGVSYWVPTTLDMAVFAEVLWRTLGIDDRGLINYPGTIQYALTMTLPRFDGPRGPVLKSTGMGELPPIPGRYDIVDFGDANGSVEISLAAWVGRNHSDPVAQYLAQQVAEAKYHYGLIWYDDSAKFALPARAQLDHRMLNDLVVSRSGWAPADGVVALRSGGPANHEHADRNSVIFKAHGDRLLHDPFRADYSPAMPRWVLRLTTAHTAVLINGQGHQYHDGHEGTNPSWAFARVTAFRTGHGWMSVTSDATDAYQLVNPNVKRVDRTLVFLKPDVLLFLDRVNLGGVPATVQARFQVFNEDGRGSCAVAGETFQIDRPFASLRARVAASRSFKIGPGRIAIAAEEGIFPFVEVATTEGLEHIILTVCTAAPAGAEHGEITLSQKDGIWRAQGLHLSRRIDLTLGAWVEAAPVVTVHA